MTTASSGTVGDETQAYIDGCAASGRAEGTLEQYGICLMSYRASGLAGVLVGRMTPDDVRAHLAWRRGHVFDDGEAIVGKSSNAVLARERGLLACVFNRIVREDRLTKNPVALVPAPKKKQTNKRAFELDELAVFLPAARDAAGDLYSMLVTGFNTGLGEDELIALRWGDLSLPRQTAQIVRKKTGRSIVFFLNGAALEALTELRESRGRIPQANEHVFQSRYGRPYVTFPRSAWKAALKGAGLVGRSLTPHSMRRTFATYFPGTDRDCQELLGHADLATTLLYRRARDDRKKAAVNAMHIDARCQKVSELSEAGS